MGKSGMEVADSKRIVNLERVCQNNIVVEDIKSNESSVFRQEYMQAASVIDGILQFNKEHEVQETNRIKAEYQTAVPFIGERGTGKTSAMCSVLHMLKTDPEAFLNCSKEKGKVGFICMDMIDINSMKPNENLMEIILAQMLICMQEQEKKLNCQEGYTLDRWHSRQREIYTQIDALSRAFSRLHWHKNFDPEEQGIVGIQKIADTKNAIKGFHELVRDFIEAFHPLHSSKTSHYLVLALDDIDMFRGMNQQERNSQFAILEQIYDYLRIPNVIVLLTFNEQILKRNCMSHYCNAHFKRSFTQECTPDEQEEIAVLTKQFLSKLFPQEQRIYMPNFLYVNTDNTPNLCVVPLKDGETIPFPPFTDDGCSQKPPVIPVKEFMLRLIAYKTGVFFDINGTKQHFLEPRNLRELGTMLQVVFRWPDPNEPSSSEQIKTQNREKFLNYIRNQFAGERLRPEEYQHFQRLSTLPVVRQSRDLIDDVRRFRMASVNNPDEFGYIGSTNRDRWKYSYGELTHNIYFSTRVHSSGGILYSKAYIHCILGSQSIILNRMPVMENKRPILEFVGSSIGGRWSNEMLPKFKILNVLGNSKYAAGSCSASAAVFLNLRLPDAIQKIILPDAIQKEIFKKEKDRRDEMIQQFAEALAIIGMFFTGYPAAGLKAKLDVDITKPLDANAPIFYLESASEDHVCFNALNPFLNLYAVTDFGDYCTERDYLSYIFKKIFSLTEKFPDSFLSNLEAKKDLGYATSAPSPKDDPQKQAQNMKTSDIGEQAKKLLEVIQPKKEELEQFAKAWKDALNLLGDIEVSSDGIIKSVSFAEQSIVFTPGNQNVGMTLPIQHFDMMYNILKRVSNVSYHDIPEEADASEAYDYFVRLYEKIGRELEEQDKQYGSVSPGFAKLYRESFFYQIFTEKDEKYRNPYLRELFNAIIQNMLAYTEARQNTRIGSNK